MSMLNNQRVNHRSKSMASNGTQGLDAAGFRAPAIDSWPRWEETLVPRSAKSCLFFFGNGMKHWNMVDLVDSWFS